MDNKHPLNELLAAAMDKARAMVDGNTVVGTPIVTDEVTLIPVSRISIGVASGGSDFAQKNQRPDRDNAFGGGAGAGVNVIPLAFIVVRGESVKLLPIVPPNDALDRAVTMIPEVMDRVESFIDKRKEKKDVEEF